jgi:hypothetical protein
VLLVMQWKGSHYFFMLKLANIIYFVSFSYMQILFLRTKIVDSASTNYCLKWNSDSAYLRRKEATGFEYMHRSRLHERWFCLVHLVAPKGMAQAPPFRYFLLSLLRFNMFLYLKLVGILVQIVLLKTPWEPLSTLL